MFALFPVNSNSDDALDLKNIAVYSSKKQFSLSSRFTFNGNSAPSLFFYLYVLCMWIFASK